MAELKDLQFLSQLIEKLDLSIKKLEKAYQDNSAENFNLFKKEIIDSQSKISLYLKDYQN